LSEAQAVLLAVLLMRGQKRKECAALFPFTGNLERYISDPTSYFAFILETVFGSSLLGSQPL